MLPVSSGIRENSESWARRPNSHEFGYIDILLLSDSRLEGGLCNAREDGRMTRHKPYPASHSPILPRLDTCLP